MGGNGAGGKGGAQKLQARQWLRYRTGFEIRESGDHSVTDSGIHETHQEARFELDSLGALAPPGTLPVC